MPFWFEQNVLAVKAEVRCGRLGVPIRNASTWAIASVGDFTPLLRRVDLIGQSHLGEGLDLERIGLGVPEFARVVDLLAG